MNDRRRPETPRPYTLVAELTYRCPLSCGYCSNPLELARHADELDTADWRAVFAEAAALGVLQVNLTGGEPLVRADLEELVAAARRAASSTSTSSPAASPLDARAAGAAGGGGARQRAALDPGHATRTARPGSRAATTSTAKLEVAAGRARARAAAHAERRPPPRQHRARAASSSRWPSGSAPSGSSSRTRSTSAGRSPTGTRCCRRARTSKRRAASRAAARERLRGKMEILFVRPDYYADRPRACMDGWARRYIVVTPDGVALPCHQARSIAALSPFENVRARSLGGDLERLARASAPSAARPGCRSPAGPATSATIDFGGCRCQAFALLGDAAATDPACALVAPARAGASRRAPAPMQPAAGRSPLRLRPPAPVANSA